MTRKLVYDYSAFKIVLINLTKILMRPFEQKEVEILDITLKNRKKDKT